MLLLRPGDWDPKFQALISICSLIVSKSILADLHDRYRRFVPSLDALPASVWKRAGALNTWGTNAIEGNTLTRDDVDRLLLLNESVPDHPIHEVIETLQHERAFRSLSNRIAKPIDLVTVLDLHGEMFAGVPAKRPGQWRLSNVAIAGTRHRPPRREQVITHMAEWVRDLAVRGAPDFETAAWMHHRFEQIHPFEDGNGRVGRLLLNLWLMQQGRPPLHILPPDRDEYLGALDAGNSGDLEPMEAYLRRCMGRSLLDLLDQVGEPADELVDLATLARLPGCPYDAAYLALRCRQGALPGLHVDESSDAFRGRKRGRVRWLSSEITLRLYIQEVGR